MDRRTIALSRLSQLIWLIFGIIEGLIGLRFILKLVAANPGNSFASLIFDTTDALLQPFLGLTRVPSIGNFELEFPALIGMVVYLLLAWVILRFLWILFGTPPRELQSSGS